MAESGAMAAPNVNPLSIREEGPHLDRSAAELEELARELIKAGHHERVVRGLIGWLVLKAAGLPDTTGAPTRSRYRRMLADLDGGAISATTACR